MNAWRTGSLPVVTFWMTVIMTPASEGFARTRDKSPAAQVDLQLVLAVDVSGSVTPKELALQRNGYAQAFRSSEMMRAVATGKNDRILVTYVEWSGPGQQRLAIAWTLIETAADAEEFASKLQGLSLNPPSGSGGSTSISSLLLFSSGLFTDAIGRPPRRVIDVSGNGTNYAGSAVLLARNRAVDRGITINGLAIDIRARDRGVPNQLLSYFEKCVIGGPGAFAVGVDDASQVEQAILRKMLGEIVASAPVLIRASAASGSLSELDCLTPGDRPYR